MPRARVPGECMPSTRVPGECMPSTRNILCLNETEFWQVALGKSDNSGKNSETIGGDREGLSSHPCSSEN